MTNPTGAAGAAGRAQNAPGGAGGGRDAGSTSVMPAVGAAAADGAPQAPRRRQGGPNGEQAQARAAAEAAAGHTSIGESTPGPAPAAPAAGGGYSTPVTYSKGQPTPPRGTPVPGAASGRPGGQSEPSRRPGPAAPPSGRTRRARLRVVRTDPWTVMKVSFLLSIALGVITIVGVSLLWMVLDAAGVFSSVGGTLKQATTGTDTTSGFDLQSYLSFGNVFLYTLLVAVIDVVLLTALCTIGSFIYNTAAGMTGGIELTLAEED